MTSEQPVNETVTQSASNRAGCLGCLAVLAIAALLVGYVSWWAFGKPDPLGLSPRHLAAVCPGFEAEDPNNLYYDSEEGVFVVFFDDRWQVEIKADSPDAPSAYAEMEIRSAPEFAEVGASFVASIITAVPEHAAFSPAAAAFVREDWGELVSIRYFGDTRVRMDVYDGRVTVIRVTGR